MPATAASLRDGGGAIDLRRTYWRQLSMLAASDLAFPSAAYGGAAATSAHRRRRVARHISTRLAALTATVGGLRCLQPQHILADGDGAGHPLASQRHCGPASATEQNGTTPPHWALAGGGRRRRHRTHSGEYGALDLSQKAEASASARRSCLVLWRLFCSREALAAFSLSPLALS